MTLSMALEAVVSVLFTTARTATWLMLAPPFSNRAVPVQAKVLLSLGLAIVVQPSVRVPRPLLALNAWEFFQALMFEVLAGAVLGFCCLVMFSAVQAAGNTLDIFGGLQMAFAYDGQSQASASPLGRFYGMAAMALLFTSNAHLLVVQGLAHSFRLLPLGEPMALDQVSKSLTIAVTELFLTTLQIAGPLVVVMFLTDVGLGLLTRVAPMLNAFVLGFPLKVMVILGIVAIGFSALPAVVEALVQSALELSAAVLRR